MKHAALLAALSVIALAACDKNPADEPFAPPARTAPTSALPPGHPVVTPGTTAMALPQEPDTAETERATVVGTIDIEGFSYIEVKQGNQTRWLAAKTTQAKKGDVVEFDSGSTMSNFTSKVLDRTFPSMTFVNDITVVKGK